MSFLLRKKGFRNCLEQLVIKNSNEPTNNFAAENKCTALTSFGSYENLMKKMR